jgi:hypothetical protein
MREGIFPLRVAHIDIGRQPETVDFIKRFIKFSADNGYNAVELYLEGRVRTASFPYHPTEESYSHEQMQEVAAYAASLNIEIIPVVSILSCAKLFLKYHELEHLAELRDSGTGRFWHDRKTMFCPSLPETGDFLEKYLTEISELFPGRFFHVGCDETWDIGYCERCRQRLENGQSEADIFLQHLLLGHEILTGKLKRRMLVWDDMFEFYPEALENLPRDIVMVCWQYQENSEPVRAHFLNHLVTDLLGEYDRLGFDYLICPADFMTVHNVETFTRYAAKHKPLGAILATWEKWDAFMPQSLPWVAYAGRLLASGLTGRQECIFAETVRDCLGVDDPVLAQALYSAYSIGFHKDRKITLESFLTEYENDYKHGRIRLVETLLLLLPPHLEKVLPEAREILRDLILTLKSEKVSFEFNKILPLYFDENPDYAELDRQMVENISRLEEVARERIAMWHRVRPGIVPCNSETLYNGYLVNMRAAPEKAKRSGYVKVHFFLPDQYCAQQVRLLVRYQNGGEWEEIACGQMKALPDMDCFFSRIFLIDREQVPVALRVETRGYGGQGFTYFEAANNTGRYTPDKILNISGILTDPNRLLTYDWKWSYAGEVDVEKAFRNRDIAELTHSFEISLRKE